MTKYLAEYSKYSNGEKKFNGFWEICGNRLVNLNGGWHDYRPSKNDKVYEVENYEDLPFRDYYINNDFKTGWLDRNGNFFGCDYMEHEFVAWYVFHKEEHELEEMGWVKIYKNIFEGGYDYLHYSRLPLTDSQKKYLIDNGFDIKKYDE